ncbi:MAG: SPOR domain-containing protein [Steroidobacteraceae bacterium]
MEDKLKQRLTGAAILIAIVVLVVPELFRGQARNDTPQKNTQTTALPQRSVTIQLQDAPSNPSAESGGASSGNVGMAVAAEQHPAPEAAAAAEQQDEATSAAAAAATAAAAEAARAQNPAALPADTAAVAPTTQAPEDSARSTAAAQSSGAAKAAATAQPGAARSGAARPEAPKPEPVARPAASSAASTPSNSTGRSGWSVQLGVFSQRENAERLRKQASGKGMTVEISGPDQRGLYRVRSEIQSDRAAAQRWQQRAQGLGFAGALTQQP